MSFSYSPTTIKIINGENLEECFEYSLQKLTKVYFLKLKIRNNVKNSLFSYSHWTLIYKNIILFDYSYLEFYQVSPNDEIFFGRIERMLKEDDIIVEVFLVHWIPTLVHLVVKRNASIGQIKLIIARIVPDCEHFNIWNFDGQLLGDDQDVIETDSRGYYKVIISCDGIARTFLECCQLHDKRLVMTSSDNHLRGFLLNPHLTRREEFKKQVIRFKSLVSSIVSNDPRFQNCFKYFSRVYQDSRFLFCTTMAERFLDIFGDHWPNVGIKYKNNQSDSFRLSFGDAIRLAIYDYPRDAIFLSNNMERSANLIVNQALKYWEDQVTLGTDLERIFLDEFFLKPKTNRELNEIVRNGVDWYRYIYIEMHGAVLAELAFPTETTTVLQARKAVSWQLGITHNEVLLIISEHDNAPKDEDRFALIDYPDLEDLAGFDGFVFEIIGKMSDLVILKKVGQGAFGDAFLCENKISQKRYVMKKPKQTSLDLYRDINSLSRIRYSPNILHYDGLFLDREYICIAMEYLPGGSLEEVLRRGHSFSEEEVAKICYDILIQIVEIHRKGVIHRDIKSDNIVFYDNHKAKLIDFGLSKYIRSLTPEQILENLKKYKPGTIPYMAPELIGKQPYTEKIDIWSFGATVTEMITRKRPYHGILPIQAAVMISKKRFVEPPNNISKDLKQFLELCLKPDPNERASASELFESSFISNIGDLCKHQANIEKA